MTETIVKNEQPLRLLDGPAATASDEQLVAMLVDRARADGLQLTGEGGLLPQLTKRVLESALARSPTTSATRGPTVAAGAAATAATAAGPRPY